MKRQLIENKGIPASVVFTMAVLAAFTVANLYYNQPLLELIRADFGIGETQANLITVLTQVGYACGLFFVIPLADKIPSRGIVITTMSVAVIAAAVISVSPSVGCVWAASLLLGLCSITPQLFIPVASRFSVPEKKSQNMGYVASGAMLGILSARVLSGYIGGWLGWRGMFAIAAVIMVVALVVTLFLIPGMKPSFEGSYASLMKTVVGIFLSHPRIRRNSFRAAFCFGSMLSIWSCMAFHLAGEPFYAGSDKVGLLGLCGVAGAIAASGVGKYIPEVGILRMSYIGVCLQLAGWAFAFFMGGSYAGLIIAIILCDIGAQCQQLSNQSGCLEEVPEATNRANTIFMTLLFLGGSLGTFLSGIGWSHAGWSGVCLVGALFSLGSLSISVSESLHAKCR